jgi:hypothetical protein
MEYDETHDHTEGVQGAPSRFLRRNGFERGYLCRLYVKPGNRSIRHLYWLRHVDGARGGVAVSEDAACRFTYTDYDFRLHGSEQYADKYELHQAVGKLLEDAESAGRENLRENAIRGARYKAGELQRHLDKALDEDSYRGNILGILSRLGEDRLRKELKDCVSDLEQALSRVRDL